MASAQVVARWRLLAEQLEAQLRSGGLTWRRRKDCEKLLVNLRRLLAEHDRTHKGGSMSFTPLKDAVEKAVRDQLGRQPLGMAEEAATKLQIYKSHPGLLMAVMQEEREGHQVEKHLEAAIVGQLMQAAAEPEPSPNYDFAGSLETLRKADAIINAGRAARGEAPLPSVEEQLAEELATIRRGGMRIEKSATPASLRLAWV